MSQERLEASLDIDRLPSLEIVRIISAQDQLVAEAVASESLRIAQAIDAVADRLRNRGRLFYVGAGTSGRIAMLDASELHPTFGIDRSMVQVIIAGGEGAYLEAAEGAEDREDEAISAIESKVRPEDAVIGIAASGSTPFTIAAIRRANLNGALTVGITSVPGSPLSRECDIPIVIVTGPEVIMGSSRMKSGTAQKMVLNILSTGVMIQLGTVYSNLMVSMPPTNAKLQSRAVQMIELAAGTDRKTAASVFQTSGGRVKESILMIRRNLTKEQARELLISCKDNLREALER